MNKIRRGLAIFDWDGVLADSAPFYVDVYRRICDHFGRAFPIKTVDEFREWYDSEWENNFVSLGFPRDQIPELLDYEATLVDYRSVPLFPDLRNALAVMGRDFHIAVASTTGSAFIEKKIAEEGMDGIIEFVSGGDDGSSDKKNKIGRVLEHFAVPSRAAIMVGDTVMDIECARALEIPSIAVTYGWNSRRRLEAAEPDLIVDTPADVVPAIRRLVKMNGNDG